MNAATTIALAYEYSSDNGQTWTMLPGMYNSDRHADTAIPAIRRTCTSIVRPLAAQPESMVHVWAGSGQRMPYFATAWLNGRCLGQTNRCGSPEAARRAASEMIVRAAAK